MKGASIALIAIGAMLLASSAVLLPRNQSLSPLPPHVEQAFTLWRQRFGVHISNPEELAFRRGLFFKTFQFVQQHNSEGHSFEVEVGKFAILTPQEFEARHTGLKVPKDFKPKLRPEGPGNQGNVHVGDLPITVNWVAQGMVSPIKDQGECDADWAFSANDTIESCWAINKHTLVALSEQELVDCSNAYGNNGCNGGWMDNSYNYVIGNDGIDSSSTYPYTGAQGPVCKSKQGTVASRITDYFDAPQYNAPALFAIVAQQPVSVSIYAGSSQFLNYKQGLFEYKGCPTATNHGVGIVGYQNDQNANPTNYWIVRNSWGANWGQGGYIWMSNTVNAKVGSQGICGILTHPSYTISA
jgi:hypothetical protein